MNSLTIIGNLTRDPEMRTTRDGINVCSFSVAVNRRRREGQEKETDYFRVTAWRKLGENCAKCLHKGSKVAVTGSVSVSTYQAQDGSTRASLDVNANEVEFISPKQDKPENNSGFVEVTGEDLPWN